MKSNEQNGVMLSRLNKLLGDKQDEIYKLYKRLQIRKCINNNEL